VESLWQAGGSGGSHGDGTTEDVRREAGSYGGGADEQHASTRRREQFATCETSVWNHGSNRFATN
jgi:hypothetical protein